MATVLAMADSEVPFVDQVERRVQTHLQPMLEGDEDDVDLVLVVEEACDAADEVTKLVLEHAEDCDQPACTAGCHYCCYAPLDVSWAEAVAIASHLYAHVPEEGVQALTEMLAEHERLSDGLDSLARYQQGLACPLLEPESGRCSVYTLRPLSCRGANSLDAEQCKQGCHEPDVDIEANGLVYEANFGAWKALAQVCRALDLPAEPASLSRALRTALEACQSPVDED